MQVKRVIQGLAGIINRADIAYCITCLILGILIGVIVGVSITNEPEQPPIVENPVEIVDNSTIEEMTEATTEVTTTEKQEKFIELQVTATAYDHCQKCCGVWATNRPKDENGNDIVITASGTIATEGRTIAVDPRVIPYGTEVIINGHTYIAEDCGGAVKGNAIDIYFDSHEEAVAFGKRSVDVKIKV